MEAKLVAFAEQVGRFAGTVRAKTGNALDPAVIRDEIQQVRDRAADLLEQLAGFAPDSPGRGVRKSAAQAAGKNTKGRSGGVVDAPGKKHRKPTANQRRPTTNPRVAASAMKRLPKRRIIPTRG
ncbi:MAG TPA: hypothetical protein VGH34_10080 [Vicinamibacterales bacterium]|jgi:hypothetical protein